MKIEKSVQFEMDFSNAAVYLADRNPEAAGRLIESVEVAVALLSNHPVIGPVWKHSRPGRPTRFLLVPGFRNYLLFYRIEGNSILLGRLLHGAQEVQDVLDESDDKESSP